YHSAPLELDFTLQDGVILGASLDGREQPGALRGAVGSIHSTDFLRISLPGEGARRVSLRWQHKEGTEALSRPRLQGPRLQQEGKCPSLWTLNIPSGLHVADEPPPEGKPETTFRGGPSAAARLALRRAETYLQLTKLLLESGEARPARKDAGASGTGSREAQLRSLQQRFALSCRNADVLLRSTQNEELREHLESLHRENRQLTDGPGS